MEAHEVLSIFKECGALLEGHFRYTSGRHGRQFLQAARVLQFPEFTERLCRALAEPFGACGVELVVGPATGGIVLAYETARSLGARAAYTEKDGEGGMALKRGFALKPGARVLVVEDVITTGGSVHKTIAHLRARGAEVVGVGVLLDRSGGEATFDCRFAPLARLDMESWPPGACALCKDGIALIEPDDLVNQG
ncbi:MAG TPA: orotate phosphoribosyltransferase [Candidatus Hydrogenedentes bacterium]|nr:orotate phosphoribosyltransferase [Candidatus Hydrogenedentota bacterium]HOV76037.1 orotate phosphoribosyltransferase [Candidatus Hydrogenedentota bacterium]